MHWCRIFHCVAAARCRSEQVAWVGKFWTNRGGTIALALALAIAAWALLCGVFVLLHWLL